MIMTLVCSRLKAPVEPLTGYVFDDLNGNGVDDGEPGMVGVTVQFSTGQNAVTNLAGMYTMEVPFDQPVTVSIIPPPSSYFCSAPQSMYTQTFPPANGTYTVTVTAGSPVSNGNFFGIEEAGNFFDVGIISVGTFAGVHAGQDFNAWMDFKASGIISDPVYAAAFL